MGKSRALILGSSNLALTALKVKHAGPGRHGDGRGLYLEVQPSGSRSWILRMQFQGTRRDLGLGSVRDVSLVEARIAAAEMRRKVRNGVDPSAERRAARKSTPSFETAARACYETLKAGWKDSRTKIWISSFERHVFPMIGSLAVDKVDALVVRDVLEPIWLAVPDTATKVLQRINAVLDFAHIKGWIGKEVSLRSVRKGLPRQTNVGGHYAAMAYADVPGFVQEISAMPPSLGRDALRLTIYTATRSNETRMAVWSEFDLNKGVWSIPAERMKMRVAHLIPLSDPALQLLRRMYENRSEDDKLLFSTNGTKPISDMTMSKVLRDLKISDVTVHGFRSAFTDWSSEMTDFPKEVADKALAHKVPDRVEAAYRRTDFFDKRRKLMGAWAAYLHQDK
ncbi:MULTISPECIES: site-specific integrase [unclassified Caulobacter]|uniref:tyrosine-type recombinase/integrase n=1 Tax=unclassified Caulobacter TaxID=2648921 RepID=UPI002103F4A5|nr:MULTISPECIES: site-specific integrase [unclassified Caulobacter]